MGGVPEVGVLSGGVAVVVVVDEAIELVTLLAVESGINGININVATLM